MKKILSIALITSMAFHGSAYNDVKSSGKKSSALNDIAANCPIPRTSSELDINNVRTLIHTAGDFWKVLGQNEAAYEVPAGSGRTSIFGGALWLGGQDVSGQLKVAAQRYRTPGVDYWPGPLSTQDAEISPETCIAYDRHWKSTKDEVAEFVAWYEAGLVDAEVQNSSYPNYSVPAFIEEWPTEGRNFEPYNESATLAPFVDRDGNGVYDPNDGDYPAYDLTGKNECDRGNIQEIYGDQNLWWVFNDKGNIHLESNSAAIGMEIRAQAFAFATQDEINNMTFYNYELHNRSTFTLTNTYFGVFADADIGGSEDDYVGCDVQRGLGFCYNGDEDDQSANGAEGYGSNPPAIGIDFFLGPFQDNDGRDNPGPPTTNVVLSYADALAAPDPIYGVDGIPYRGLGVGYGDSIIDNERFGMSAFVYFDRTVPFPRTDPSSGAQYYNYLRGIWQDGTPMTYGGTGYSASGGTRTRYMFPRESDIVGWGSGGQVFTDNWSDEVNTPGDRRFIESSGPFTLTPGQINNITFGVVWADATQGGRLQSLANVIRADDKTQALFDACFKLLNGPDAPVLTVQELDKEIILYLNNPQISNNFKEEYLELDPSEIAPDSVTENGIKRPLNILEKSSFSTYKFQGYQVYQLADANVSSADLDNPERARLVKQMDLEDNIVKLVNLRDDDDTDLIVPELMVNGANGGVVHSLQIETDLFAEGDNKLVNHKTYYFMALAYGANQYRNFFPEAEADEIPYVQYLPSRKAPTGVIPSVAAIPHQPEVEFGGVELNTQYGDLIGVQQLEGQGNSGFALEFDADKDEQVDLLFKQGHRIDQPYYAAGGSPIEVKVIDPLNVKGGKYTLKFVHVEKDTLKETVDTDISDNEWILYGDSLGNDTVRSSQTVRVMNEALIPRLGISISLGQQVDHDLGNFSDGVIGAAKRPVDNGLISIDVEFENESSPWLTGVFDDDIVAQNNWIKSGIGEPNISPISYNDTLSDHFLYYPSSDAVRFLDPNEDFEDFGWIAPMRLTSNVYGGPLPYPGANENFELYNRTTRASLFGFFADATGDQANESLLDNLASVDVIITDDKSKWSRVPVLEVNADGSQFTEGDALKGRLRDSRSVDKNGLPADTTDTVASLNPNSPNYIAARGMGWFPGYAVNLETGERLNMAFGEDSYRLAENGRDMIWNPTENISDGPSGGGTASQTLLNGGSHFIYVFANNITAEERALEGPDIAAANINNLAFSNPGTRMPSYDDGTYMAEQLKINSVAALRNVYQAGMWVAWPLLDNQYADAKDFDKNLENEVKIKLRVKKSFKPNSTGPMIQPGDPLKIGTEYLVNLGPINHDGVTYMRNDYFTATQTSFSIPANFDYAFQPVPYPVLEDSNILIETVNGGRPLYNFEINPDLEPVKNLNNIAKDMLDEIRAVPNPYYAYSSYETGKNDNRVKIINLPEKCSIRIYTLNGDLLRTFEKDDPETVSIDWDLENFAKVPIAGGMYLIHVEVPGVGEKVVKLMAMMRPIDLDNF